MPEDFSPSWDIGFDPSKKILVKLFEHPGDVFTIHDSEEPFVPNCFNRWYRYVWVTPEQIAALQWATARNTQTVLTQIWNGR